VEVITLPNSSPNDFAILSPRATEFVHAKIFAFRLGLDIIYGFINIKFYRVANL
jgi:hypothetical protein